MPNQRFATRRDRQVTESDLWIAENSAALTPLGADEFGCELWTRDTDMVGPSKVLRGFFFILFLLLGGPPWAVKSTGDVEAVATVDQTDMRGLVTA